jgi:hypothetical protein
VPLAPVTPIMMRKIPPWVVEDRRTHDLFRKG